MIEGLAGEFPVEGEGAPVGEEPVIDEAPAQADGEDLSAFGFDVREVE